MAPERFDGWSDPRSDVYALGATLYELLTLRPLFEDANRARLIERVLHEAPAPPRKHRPPDPARPGDDRPEGDGQGARGAVRHGRGDGRGPAAVPRRQADPGAAQQPGREAWRWCRRNPAVAGMAATLMVVFLAAFAAVTAALVQARADRKLANERLVAAKASEAAAKAEKAAGRRRLRPGPRGGRRLPEQGHGGRHAQGDAEAQAAAPQAPGIGRHLLPRVPPRPPRRPLAAHEIAAVTLRMARVLPSRAVIT